MKRRMLNEEDSRTICAFFGVDGKGGLLDDVLQDAERAAVFAGRVHKARRGRVRDDQGGTVDGRRVQNTGLVSEDARRSAEQALTL